MNETTNSYKLHVMARLDEFLFDAIHNDEISSDELSEAILKSVNDSVDYHRSSLQKSVSILAKLKGSLPSTTKPVIQLNDDLEHAENYWDLYRNNNG